MTLAKSSGFVILSLLTAKHGQTQQPPTVLRHTQIAVKTGSTNLQRVCLLSLIPNTSVSLGPDSTGALNKCVLKEWMNNVL